jgi:hypothetical protein
MERKVPAIFMKKYISAIKKLTEAIALNISLKL